jgi:hypothetical protein
MRFMIVAPISAPIGPMLVWYSSRAVTIVESPVASIDQVESAFLSIGAPSISKL